MKLGSISKSTGHHLVSLSPCSNISPFHYVSLPVTTVHYLSLLQPQGRLTTGLSRGYFKDMNYYHMMNLPKPEKRGAVGPVKDAPEILAREYVSVLIE